MQTTQREQNPDVNSYNADTDSIEDTDTGTDDDASTDVERGQDNIPIPPDATPPVPVEEPPGTDGPPVGDVDDSPKQIA